MTIPNMTNQSSAKSGVTGSSTFGDFNYKSNSGLILAAVVVAALYFGSK